MPNKPQTVRLSETMIARLKALATKEGRPYSGLLRWLLETHPRVK